MKNIRIQVALFYALLFAACSSYAQTQTGGSSAHTVLQKADTSGFYLTLDPKSEKLSIPVGSPSFKIYGVKIFDSEGKELISKRIDSSKPIDIDVSKLPDGVYIVHVVTEDQTLYKTSLAIWR